MNISGVKLSTLFTLTFLTACSWVTLSPEGSKVEVTEAEHVARCDRVGQITATTRSKVIADRDSEKVKNELETLARNEAVKLGANHIIPLNQPTNGEQSFGAYDCHHH